jgi:hypothetical protein
MVNVWCWLVCDRILGPFFFVKNTINTQVYLDMLKNFLFPRLEENDLTNTIIFQQDGPLPHFSRRVMGVPNAEFRGRWIGRDDTILWPSRSLDFKPTEFFFWGYVQNYVYMDKIQNLSPLKSETREAAEQATRDMLQRAWLQGHEGCRCGNLLCSKLFEVHLKVKY